MNKEYDDNNKGVLWKKTSKSGQEYFSGNIKINSEEYRITMFTNNKKGNEKAPDFRLIAEPKEPQESVQALPEDPYKDFGTSQEKAQEIFDQSVVITDDDLPF